MRWQRASSRAAPAAFGAAIAPIDNSRRNQTKRRKDCALRTHFGNGSDNLLQAARYGLKTILKFKRVEQYQVRTGGGTIGTDGRRYKG